jgi:hypothetical protein
MIETGSRLENPMMKQKMRTFFRRHIDEKKKKCGFYLP